MISFDQLLTYLESLNSITDPILKAYKLEVIAKDIDIPVDTLQKMLKDYQRQKTEEAAKQSFWKRKSWMIEVQLEKINTNLAEMDIFNILEYCGRLSILLGILLFFWEIPERQAARLDQEKQTIYQAWEIITDNQTKEFSAGRIQALQDLNQLNHTLAYVDISNAYLSDFKHPLNLKNVDLFRANLNGATLIRADFSNADLSKSSAVKTKFLSSQFIRADLKESDFRQADFYNAKLQGANLNNSQLQQAILYEADLTGATIKEADLEKADLRYAKLIKVNLKNSTLKNANLIGANLSETDLSEVDLKNAIYNQDTIFLEDFEVDQKSNMILIKDKINLKGKDLSFYGFDKIDISGSDLSFANLEKSSFFMTNLTDVKMDQANLKNADFRGAIGLTTQQIHTTLNWQDAEFDKDLLKDLNL